MGCTGKGRWWQKAKRGRGQAETGVNGDRIYVAGRLVQNSWEGDDGQRRHRTEVHASEVVFLDSRNGNGNGDAADIEQPVGASPF